VLTSGTKLGTYEITALIGAGGMGEVYRAHDTKLGRDVAIKVLPEHFAREPERLARFQREAKMLAALNHPNIAAIYGLEQSGSTHYLVMELVEGPTLAERILSGPVPVDETLPIARQVADAVEYAHDHNVIHRDLKPANIKVTAEGMVKVLDFGLAKAMSDEPTAAEISNSPTLSMAATRQGVILGTAAYMSPEQAKGKAADRRADVWAFGVVLFELLTGKQAFQGEDVTEILAAVVMKEPALDALPAKTPPAIRNLVRRCLEKTLRRRLPHIGEARMIIEDVLSGAAPTEPVTGTAARSKVRERLTQAAAAVMTLIAMAFAIGFVLRAPQPAQPMRLSTEIGADASLYTLYGTAAIFSPDGTRMAFVAAVAGQTRRIYVRSLDQLQATALSGTENSRDPFFSPDGQWLGFFADAKLKKISVQGGAAVTLCDAINDRGGSWGDDGTIVFTPNTTVPLSKVSSAGGTPQPLTTLDTQAGEITHRWPQVLPGSKSVLFTSNTNTTNFEDSEVVVYSMVSGQRKTVQRGGFHARYLPSGHVVYLHEGTLFAVPFDLQRLEITGQPAPVLEGVVTTPGGAGAQYSFSDGGNLVYVAGLAGGADVSIYWMDRDGKFTPLREAPGNYTNPAFSPDGKRLALQINDGKRSDVWVYEWERDTLTRLTFAGEGNGFPLWTPDGQRITYSSQDKGGGYNLWWIRADGAGNPQRLTESKSTEYARSWRPDGKVLAFRQSNPGTVVDILTLPMEGDEKAGWKPGKPQPFVNTAFLEDGPSFSPDGRWLAYVSFESGTSEVYVRPFPGPGGKWLISTDSASGDSFRADKPQLWSPGQFTDRGGGIGNFDLHPDGKRFAVLKSQGTEQAPAVNKVNIVLNWFDELKRRVPPGN